MELQQGWHRKDSSDSHRNDKRESEQEKSEANNTTGQHIGRAGRNDEGSAILTNEQGRHDEGAAVTSLVTDGQKISRGDHGNLSQQRSKVGNHKDGNDTRESVDLRRSSVEIQELLVQRFGSIRR